MTFKLMTCIPTALLLISIVGCNDLSTSSQVSTPSSFTPATAYTISGPTSGQMSMASTNFTIQPSGYITTDLVVTPDDGGSGGTFTPAQITFVADGTNTPAAQTFTYQAASLANYNLTFTHAGDAGIIDPTDMTYSTASIVAPNDSNIFLTPENWISSGSDFIESSNPGAYIKLGFTGTSLQLVIDSFTNCFELPKIGYTVDGGAVQYFTVADYQTSLVVPLVTGLSPGDHQIRISIEGLGYTDRWILDGIVGSPGITNKDRLKILKIGLDIGAHTIAPVLKPKRLIVYGDSITEGANTLGDQNFVYNKQWSTTWDALLADSLNAEVGVIAFQGQGFEAVGEGNVPEYLTAYDHIRQDTPRVFTVPDYVVVLHGANGTVTQADVAAALVNMQTAYPNSDIYLGVPFGGYNRQAITDAFNGQANSHTYFFDLGSDGEDIIAADTTDGTHPTPTGFSLLEPLMLNYIPHP